jgi:hypothetical protein
MVFLLVMRKPAGFQAAKNRSQKRLAFFIGSARVGIVEITALAVSVFGSPPPGGFSFCYVIGFPSGLVNTEVAGRRNRLGHRKSV